MANIFLCWLVGWGYLSNLFLIKTTGFVLHVKILLFVFAVLSYLGQLGLLIFILGGLVVLVAYFIPQRFLIIGLSWLLASVVVCFVWIDSTVFKFYQFHLNSVLIDFIFQSWKNTVLDLSGMEIFWCMLVTMTLVSVEMGLACWLWVRQKKIMQAIKNMLFFLLVCFYCSYSLVAVHADNILGRYFLDAARAFPFYTTTLGAILPVKNGKQGLEKIGEFFPVLLPSSSHAPLRYPLHPLQCEAVKKPLNLVVIVVDSWRFDLLKKQIMPYTTKFSETAWNFTQHFSGGNATGPGIFSLFYGLPANYWSAMESQRKGPLLLDELLQQHYRMGIFSSATLRVPSFQQTVFSAISNLAVDQQEGATPYERDQRVTNKFIDFIRQGSQPFFSFLFFDAAHGYCSFDNDIQIFKPVVKKCDRTRLLHHVESRSYLNRYKNALVLVDQEIKKVVMALKAQQLLDHTVIVITGDHGQEFDDNHLGYWEHATNFTKYQVQTPLIIDWPGQKPRVFLQRTSHFDVAPTLLKRLLGCRNELNDVSEGKDLLGSGAQPYLIVNSYVDFAVVESNKITVMRSGGSAEVSDASAKPMPHATVDVDLMRRVLDDLKKFYF